MNGDKIFRVGEIQIIGENNLAVLQAGAQRAINVFHFQQTAVRLTRGGHQTVGAEIAVVGIIAEIAAVPRFAVRQIRTVITPFPHKTAASAGMSFHRLPVILRITAGIAHGVRIFAQ